MSQMLSCTSVPVTSMMQIILELIVHSPSTCSYVCNSEIAITATHGDIGMQLVSQEIFEKIMLEV